MKRVLVIDDDPAVRSAYALALEDSPYVVVTVPSGVEGVQQIAQAPFDLVYLDLKMPGMDGVETLYKIREVDPHVPVYLVSGFAQEFTERLEEATQEGITIELFEKPLSRAEILDLTRSVLGEVDYALEVETEEA